MKTVAFVVAFVFMVEYSLAESNETFQIERETEDSKDVLRVRDSSGELLAVIVVYEDEDFQLIKPETEDGNVCIILPAFTKETQLFKCYKRVPFPRDEYNEDELTECGNREIFTLQPQFSEYCSNNVDDSKGEMREKRAAPENCSWKERIVSTCVKKERVCNKWGWWFGRNRCKRYVDRCTKYQVDRVREYVCY